MISKFMASLLLGGHLFFRCRAGVGRVVLDPAINTQDLSWPMAGVYRAASTATGNRCVTMCEYGPCESY